MTEERLVSAGLCGKTVTASHLCNLEVKASARELLKLKPEWGVNTIAWISTCETGLDWSTLGPAGPFHYDTKIVVMIYSHPMRRYKHKIYVPQTRWLNNKMYVVYTGCFTTLGHNCRR